jgi:hypothetical protein
MVTERTTSATNRPYGPPANVSAVLQRLRTRNLPERVDAEYLRDAGVSEGTISRTLFGLRFLDLITEEGAPTQPLRSIHTSTDEEYRSNLAGLIRDAYSEVFDVVDPAQDSQDRILNVFRRYTPASQRARMVIFFLGMCREAGIPTLDVPRQRSMAEARPRRSSAVRQPPPARRVSSAPVGTPSGAKATIPPALELLIGSLPPEGSALSTKRRQQWLRMAEATLDFVYRLEEEEEEATEPEGQEEETLE